MDLHKIEQNMLIQRRRGRFVLSDLGLTKCLRPHEAAFDASMRIWSEIYLLSHSLRAPFLAYFSMTSVRVRVFASVPLEVR